jgi:hypothetical protein
MKRQHYRRVRYIRLFDLLSCNLDELRLHVDGMSPTTPVLRTVISQPKLGVAVLINVANLVHVSDGLFKQIERFREAVTVPNHGWRNLGDSDLIARLEFVVCHIEIERKAYR